MHNPFSSFKILPSYSRGFYFSWEIRGDFNDTGPWEFKVQEGLSPTGPWKGISPKLENAYAWKEEKRSPVNKSNVLYFRVQLNTPESTYYSPVLQPYSTLSRRDFLLAREIMRQSMLHSKGMAGVKGQVYVASTFGPKCHKCLDPITGMIRDSHCKYCLGTGRNPAYNGPYDLWVDFSEDNQHQTSVDKTGTIEKKSFQVKVIGNPCLKQGDVLVVPSTDKRYYINTVAMAAEIRRSPIIQTLIVDEAPQTDKIYDL